ncbi:ArnT family glycosyltransferase [Dokdonella sp.]|uniref:ArnT family glycosyltransferase n=1 Tax=Dokdonella sp. TaxID=2291710 RepID=UPI003528F082
MNQRKTFHGALSDSALVESLWIPLWLLASLFAIFQTGFMPLYSTRTLGVAWEMWNSSQFLVPYSNGEPYSHKTPLLFWLIHAGWAAGGVGDTWPRVLEVLIGLGILWLAKRLARVLFRESARVAALTPWLLAAFTFTFLFSLQIMYEMLLALCVLAALNSLVGRDPEKRPWFGWFAVAVAAGLLTKGPVMLLHIAAPYLLGPYWHPWARRSRARWYLGGGLALIAACAALVAWAIPAGQAGGEAYRHELFFMQTAGRVVDSFDHARPWWWYASVLPALLLPWLLWPRAWAALANGFAGRRHAGRRLIACWLVSVLFGFSLVSGKQAYYLVPEMAGLAILLAAGFARLAERDRLAPWWAGAWPLALAGLLGAGLLWLLPGWVAEGRVDEQALVDLSTASPWFVMAGLLLAALFLLAPRRDAPAVRYVAALSLAAACLAYTLFAQTLWPTYDLRPAAERISNLQQSGIPVAHFQVYENQFQYLGRLQKPLDVLIGGTLEPWSAAHPDGRIIYYTRKLTVEDLAYADLIQPFRSEWLIIERADSWALRRLGRTVPRPARPAERVPPDYWLYRELSEGSTPRAAEGRP